MSRLRKIELETAAIEMFGEDLFPWLTDKELRSEWLECRSLLRFRYRRKAFKVARRTEAFARAALDQNRHRRSNIFRSITKLMNWPSKAHTVAPLIKPPKN